MSSEYWLYGWHAAVAALSNENRKIKRLVITQNNEARLAKEGVHIPKNIRPEVINVQAIEKFTGKDAVHQGIAIFTNPLEEADISDLSTSTQNESEIVVALDQVTDPHNVGAIIRSAAAFGAKAIIMTKRNSPPESGALAKAAAGALEHIYIMRVNNLASSLKEIKKYGYWLVGLDGYAKQSIADFDPPQKCVLVMGSEGDGMRRLTQENCDFVVRLPISGKVESLNVSNAAAVALYGITSRMNKN